MAVEFLRLLYYNVIRNMKLKRGNTRKKIIDIYYYDCDAIDVFPACDGRFPG